MNGGGKKFFQHRSFYALFLFCLAVILWWWHPPTLFRPLQAALTTVTLPLQNFFSWTAFELASIKDFLSSIGHLKSENTRIIQDNLALQAEIAGLRQLAGENQELRAFVDLSNEKKEKLVVAEVVGRDGSGLSTWITINRGSANGLRVGLPVVAANRVLIGEVTEVSPVSATVILLPHPESVISATLASANNQGIIRGDHGLGMIFDLALESQNFKLGEAVVTSGLGENFPKGLLIGTIADIRPSSDRLFQQAVVVSPVQFSTVRFVALILP